MNRNRTLLQTLGFNLLWIGILTLWANVGSALPTDWAEYFRQRQLQAQAHTLAKLREGQTSIYAQLVRFETGEGPLDLEVFEFYLDKLNKRLDTSDFQVSALVRMLYQYGDSPLWEGDLKQRVIRTLLDFKYWIDEPGTDEMVYWSENHQILFHSSAYLMGQMFPDQVFTNSGLTGRQLMLKHETMLERWLQLRATLGFSEWHSNNYYEEDLGPLLNLVDFAEDQRMAHNAEGVAQLLLLDIALYSHAGAFGGSHGRTFERHMTDPSHEATRSVSHLVFEQGSFERYAGVSFSPLSVTKSFFPDPAVVLIGRKDWHTENGLPQVWNERSRMGFDLDNAHEFGISTDPHNLEDMIVWWGNGGYILPETLDGTFTVAKEHNLFAGSKFFRPFAGLYLFWDLGLLDLLMSNRIYLGFSQAGALLTTHTVAHHKPSAFLSVASDKSKGNPAFQNHPWSAVLNDSIQVFTSHPLRNEHEGDYMGYFTGGASMPRVAQHEDIALIIHNPRIFLTAGFSDIARTTHAYFPVDEFDQVEKVGKWYFGKKDDGYIALYSYNKSSIATSGRLANREIIAKGFRNLWICEIGWEQEDGSFKEFIERVSNQKVKFDKFLSMRVQYESDQGTLEFGWLDEFTVSGQVKPLHQNPRFENPFMQVPWGENRYEINAGPISSTINFDFPVDLIEPLPASAPAVGH